MLLNDKSLERLTEIINGDTNSPYRSGPKLVEFFNKLGFNDAYGQGFPSRWTYTIEKLKSINGTLRLEECIKHVFAPINYIGHIERLDEMIDDFNQYLAFDKCKIIRQNDTISFMYLDRVIIQSVGQTLLQAKEDEFLSIVFNVNIDSLELDIGVSNIIKERMNEIDICIKNNAPLSAILMTGSILEGILYGTAIKNPQLFNQTRCTPKDRSDKVKPFSEWTLNQYINVACEIGIIKQDVKKFGVGVRDFRNYIHPHQQLNEDFSPNIQCALICYQVLKAAIYQISEYNKSKAE